MLKHHISPGHPSLKVKRGPRQQHKCPQPLRWGLTSSLQGNSPKFIDSLDYFIHTNEHSVLNSHTACHVFPALAICVHLLLGLLVWVKQMQKVPRTCWWLWEEYGKSPPTTASSSVLSSGYTLHSADAVPWAHRATVVTSAHQNHFIVLPDGVGISFLSSY